MPNTRITPKGRERPAPRIDPVYGTRRQRNERKRREAEERNTAYQARQPKESDNASL